MRHAFDNQPHFAFENVNDLLLWMRVRWHPTTGCECCEHLIHRVAVCDGPAGDSRANFNRRILSFHGQNPTMGVWMTRMFWSDRRGDLDSAPLRNELNSSTDQILFSWFETQSLPRFFASALAALPSISES